MGLLEYFHDWELTPSLGNISGQSHQWQRLTLTGVWINLVTTPGPDSTSLGNPSPSSL